MRRLEEEVAAHLRAVRGSEDPGVLEPAEESQPEARLRIRCSPALRERWAVVHEVAERGAGERLSASDAPENQVTLCAFHHQRGLHTGWLAIRRRAPDALVFELGLRPDTRPLARYGSGDVGPPPVEGSPAARAPRAA